MCFSSSLVLRLTFHSNPQVTVLVLLTHAWSFLCSFFVIIYLPFKDLFNTFLPSIDSELSFLLSFASTQLHASEALLWGQLNLHEIKWTCHIWGTLNLYLPCTAWKNPFATLMFVVLDSFAAKVTRCVNLVLGDLLCEPPLWFYTAELQLSAFSIHLFSVKMILSKNV